MKKILILGMLALLLFCAACGGPKEVEDSPFTLRIDGWEYKGTYTGTMDQKAPNGNGSFHYADDEIEFVCSGLWENGQIKGSADLKYHGMTLKYQGERFTGDYDGKAVDGKPSGEGSFVSTAEGRRFEYSGSWIEGEIAGEGELVLDAMELTYNEIKFSGTYTGKTLDGSPNGEGSFDGSNGNDFFNYSGEWKTGAPAGKGILACSCYRMKTSDGKLRVGEYRGETLNGLASGQGVYKTTNDEGEAYTHEGEWKKGVPEGHGVRKWAVEDRPIQDGEFKNGDFMPNVLEYFTARGTYSSKPYTISKNAQSYLKNHGSVFIKNTPGDSESIDNRFDYRAFAKNPENYGSQLITVSGLKVVQIFEDNYWGADHTFCILQKGTDNIYYVNLYGFFSDIYEGSYITMTGLPMDYFTYPNVAGTKIWAVAVAGVSLKKG